MIAPTTPTGSRTNSPNPPPIDGCAGSSNGKVSASAAYDSKAPAHIIAAYCAIGCERARLPRPQLGQPVTPLLDRGTEGAEVLGPLGVRHGGPGPFVERGTGRPDGSGHVVGPGLGDA